MKVSLPSLQADRGIQQMQDATEDHKSMKENEICIYDQLHNYF